MKSEESSVLWWEWGGTKINMVSGRAERTKDLENRLFLVELDLLIERLVNTNARERW
jgi:hypothetical protein